MYNLASGGDVEEIFPFIVYKGDELFIEDVPADLLVEQFGTPLYVYSSSAVRYWYGEFDSAFREIEHLTCFAVKANSNIGVLRVLKEVGSGADTVSKGEIFRALTAGISPESIVFSGVGKRDDEIEYALERGILMFNVESEEELHRINGISGRVGKIANVAVRVNPDVNPKTHPYISTGIRESKFGIDYEMAYEVYVKASKLPNLNPVGIHFHIGSQINDVSPFREAALKVADLVSVLKGKGIDIKYFNVGGGLGVNYKPDESPVPSAKLAGAIVPVVRRTGCKLILEPGRRVIANAGVLLTKTIYTKRKDEKLFIIVDAGMNDLLRPSLYGSYHHIIPTRKLEREMVNATVVGPICETGDVFAEGREIREVRSGENIAILSAGAYGFTMSSNYNSRTRAAEVMVEGSRAYLLRQRETLADLISREVL